MADTQVPVSTKGRLIQIKSGLSADFSDDVLKVAEFGLILDTNELRIGLADGTTMKVNGGGGIENIPDASLTQKGLMTQAHVVKLNGISSGANFVQIEDNLTSTSATSALSAKQGKALKDAIDAVGSGGGGTITNIYQDNVTTGATGTAFGKNTSASGTISSVFGEGSIASGAVSFSAGYENESSGFGAITLGESNKATNSGSISIGASCLSESYGTIAIGSSCVANATSSIAIGSKAVSTGLYAMALGRSTIANVHSSSAVGQFNKELSGNRVSFNTSDDAYVIGNGTSDTSRSNAFRVKFNGSVYGLSAFNSSGADYAEYFEWLDSNPNNEDRVGYFVTLNGDKIEVANSQSNYIIGVISANPSVIGDSHQDQWQGMYVRDEWGRIQSEYVDVEYEEFDNDGNTITKTRQDYVHKLSPDFNNEVEYIGREARQEWDAVGMLGKLLVRDDGTCEVNEYARVADGGIATKSDAGYRVIKRINENIVQIIFK